MGCTKCCIKCFYQSVEYTRSLVKSVDDLIPIPSSIGAPIYMVLDTVVWASKLTENFVDAF